jgi:hypothetical protein
MQKYSLVLLSEALILLIVGIISPAQCFSRRSSFSLTASSFFNQQHPMPRTLRWSMLGRRTRCSNQLSMHMGHSHSHNEHQHPITSNSNQNSFEAFMANVQEFQPRTFIFRRRRLVAMILFLAAAIFGPSLVFRSGRRAALGRSDVTIFGVAVAAVTAAEPIRNAVLQMIQRLRSLQQGIANHSAPITASYLFANKNAADRVTLLGYVRIISLVDRS